MSTAIERSRKSKIMRISLIFVLILGVILGICHIITTEYLYSSEIYPDCQTVEAMFEENREDFDRVAEILVNSNTFQHLRELGRKSITRASIPKWNECLTKEEYATIRGFFRQHRPYEICKPNGNPKFVFLATGASVSFYYYAGDPGDFQERFLDDIKKYADELIDLQNGWYCRITARDTAESHDTKEGNK